MVTGVKGNAEANFRDGNVNLTKENIGLGNLECINDTVFIKGKSSAKPLRVRAIVGSDGTNNADGDLYLQYGTNKSVMFGQTGTHYISNNGSEYTGNSATTTKLKTAVNINGILFDGSVDISIPVPTKTSQLVNDSNFVTDIGYKTITYSTTEPPTINPNEIIYVYE